MSIRETHSYASRIDGAYYNLPRGRPAPSYRARRIAAFLVPRLSTIRYAAAPRSDEGLIGRSASGLWVRYRQQPRDARPFWTRLRLRHDRRRFGNWPKIRLDANRTRVSRRGAVPIRRL